MKYEIFSPNAVKVGASIEQDNVKYTVEKCRQLIEALGEPKGFLLTIKEIEEVKVN